MACGGYDGFKPIQRLPSLLDSETYSFRVSTYHATIIIIMHLGQQPVEKTKNAFKMANYQNTLSIFAQKIEIFQKKKSDLFSSIFLKIYDLKF